MNIKLPILEKSLLQELFSLDFVKSIKQMENKEAKQNRETGYCEMLIGSTSTLDQLMSHLEFLKKNFSLFLEEALSKLLPRAVRCTVLPNDFPPAIHFLELNRRKKIQEKKKKQRLRKKPASFLCILFKIIFKAFAFVVRKVRGRILLN